MERFLVLYRSSIPVSEMMAGVTPEQAQAGMEAWTSWAKQAEDAIVDLGAPAGNGTLVTPGSVEPSDSGISGYSVVQADSREQAIELLRDHPHFHTPGKSSIDILELLAVPGT